MKADNLILARKHVQYKHFYLPPRARRKEEKKIAEDAAKRVFVVSDWVLNWVPLCLKLVIIITGGWQTESGMLLWLHCSSAPVLHPCIHSSMGTDGGNPAVQTNYTPVTLNHTATAQGPNCRAWMHERRLVSQQKCTLFRLMRHRGGTKEGLYLYSFKSIVSVPDPEL